MTDKPTERWAPQDLDEARKRQKEWDDLVARVEALEAERDKPTGDTP